MVNKSLPQRHCLVGMPLRLGFGGNAAFNMACPQTILKEISIHVIIWLLPSRISRHDSNYTGSCGRLQDLNQIFLPKMASISDSSFGDIARERCLSHSRCVDDVLVAASNMRANRLPIAFMSPPCKVDTSIISGSCKECKRLQCDLGYSGTGLF